MRKEKCRCNPDTDDTSLGVREGLETVNREMRRESLSHPVAKERQECRSIWNVLGF